jgi:hypothetical protein
MDGEGCEGRGEAAADAFYVAWLSRAGWMRMMNESSSGDKWQNGRAKEPSNDPALESQATVLSDATVLAQGRADVGVRRPPDVRQMAARDLGFE